MKVFSWYNVTPEMKTICLGPNWKTDAEYIMKMRHKRQKKDAEHDASLVQIPVGLSF